MNMTRIAYVVSDLAPGYDRLRTPYWRPTAMVSDIILAKRWAGQHSIITEHSWQEASQIMATRTLPEDYKIIP
jgi:hypothetical protein